MKKIKDKYIRLTESDLHRIVSEEIEKLLEYKKPRRDLVDAARNHAKELVKHWSILRFNNIANLNSKCLDHWVGEIAVFINNISDVHLKGKMDDFNTRKTAITEGFSNAMVLGNKERCKTYLIQKLAEERINFQGYDDVIDEVSVECVEELPKIIDIIARCDAYEVSRYVESLAKAM